MATRRFVSDIYKLAVIVGRLTQIKIKDIEIGLQLLDFNNSEQHISRFLSVDAHALQLSKYPRPQNQFIRSIKWHVSD